MSKVPKNATVLYEVKSQSHKTTCYTWFDARATVPCEATKRLIVKEQL